MLQKACITIFGLIWLVACAPGEHPVEPGSNQPIASFDELVNGGPVCAVDSSDVGFDFELLEDDCGEIAPIGFDDQVVHFQYRYNPANRPADNSQKNVLATYEFRFLDGQQFGVRLVDAVFYDDSQGSLAETNLFPLKLIRELAGSKFRGFVDACSDIYSDPVACWENRIDDDHAEVRFCVDDPHDSTYSDAGVLCNELNDGGHDSNKLPTASFFHSWTDDSLWAYETCDTDEDGEINLFLLDRLVLDASGSSDPDDQNLTYHWEIQHATCGVITYKTPDPVTTFYFDKDEISQARLRLEDPSGGIDAQTKSLGSGGLTRN